MLSTAATTIFISIVPDALISLFRAKYGNNEKVSELRILWNKKWNSVHTILV